MFLTVNWGAIWAMTGIGLGIVFVILLLLVYVLQLFSRVARAKAAKAPAPEAKAADNAHHESDEEIAAAIAASLYLFTEETHDVESDVITIVHNDHSTWHHFN